MEKKVIFWDFDGTLVRKNTSFLTSLMEAAEEQDLKPEKSLCREFLQGACSWNHPQEAYIEKTGELWWRELLKKTEAFLEAQGLPPETCRSICEGFRYRAVSYDYSLYADAKAALTLARNQGYENYILSNNFPELSHTVKNLGLSDFLSGCLLSSVLGYEKPRKEIFRKALELAGNPKRAIMVGDNPVADIEGAAAAGLKTVQVHGESPSPKADHFFKSLLEIREIL